MDAGSATAVDTHCHIFLMDAEPADVVANARQAGIARLVCVGIDGPTSRRSLELAESFPGVFATAGVHPHSASGFDRQTSSTIEEMLIDPLTVAVGETGLDYYRRLSPPEDQRRAFRSHVALSRESGKPLVVHVREAWEDAMSILAEERAERPVLHCFSGDEALATEAMARGYFISFAGNVTYPGAHALRGAATAVHGDRLLAETDSPFLAPQALRGRPNEPANLPLVLEALASARGVTLEEITTSTSAAAMEAFRSVR